MLFPTVTIIGRPNVGKSSLLNCLARRRISIVDSISGVTRDRVSVEIEHEGKLFELIDTGGIGINDVDELTYEIEIQIELALKKADLILFVVDVREGVTTLDVDIAERLRRIKKPLLLVANKCDTPKFELQAGDFYKLGMGESLTISAIEGHGKTDLLDKIIASNFEHFPENGKLFFLDLAHLILIFIVLRFRIQIMCFIDVSKVKIRFLIFMYRLVAPNMNFLQEQTLTPRHSFPKIKTMIRNHCSDLRISDLVR